MPSTKAVTNTLAVGNNVHLGIEVRQCKLFCNIQGFPKNVNKFAKERLGSEVR